MTTTSAHKIRQAATIAAIVLCIGLPASLFPRQVEAGCTTAVASGTYTINSQSCNFDNAEDGLDLGTGFTANNAKLVISGGTLTITDSVGGAQTLVVGSFEPTNGGSIIIPTGSKIVIGGSLIAQDNDGDGVPNGATAKVGSPGGTWKRVAELDRSHVDCDDTQASVSYAIGGGCYLDNDSDGKTSGTAYTCFNSSSCSTATIADKGAGTSLTSPYSNVGHFLSSAVGSDCDDATAGVWSSQTIYADSDGDGYGSGTGTTQCVGAAPPVGYSFNNTDCDPASATRYTTRTCYFDNDNDGAYDTNGTSTCAGASCSSAAAVVSSPTYFDLDTFETAADEWNCRNDVDPSIVSTTAYAGTKSLYLPSGWGRNFELSATPYCANTCVNGSNCGTNAETGQTLSGYNTGTYPYMCMAYKIPGTTTANMLISITGVGWRSITMTQSECPATYPKVATWGPITADNAWHYKCINLDAQLTKSLGSGSKDIAAVIMHTGGTGAVSGEMWIDNFAIVNGNLMNNAAQDSAGGDCANADATKWQNVTAYYDGDNDGARTASSQVRCTGWDPSNTSADAYDLNSCAASDCCDTDNRAKPGQTTAYGTPTLCGGYDFNCDTATTQSWTTVYAGVGNAKSCTADATCTGLCSVSGIPGWQTAAPSCGSSGTYCSAATTGCLCSSYDIYNPGTCYASGVSCTSGVAQTQTCL